MSTSHAYFGGGCFWCTEAAFKLAKGVVAVDSGYAGGTVPHPTYEQISGGQTGHAEVVRVEYDPAIISYENLLKLFFASHDPTTLNRQGYDVGTEYRSIILYTAEQEKSLAEQKIAELNASSADGDPIVTEVKALGVFYPAEEYHKDYYARNPQAAYCQLVINPKLEKVQKEASDLLK
jgi:peptide-methionine (S)-S-oxide reductase